MYVFMLFIYNKTSGWNKITLRVYLVVHCDVLMDIQRTFKQLWSTISTKRTTKSHTKLLNTNKDHDIHLYDDVGNPGLGQVQKYGDVKPVHGNNTLLSW
jgi:hypothetical protein